MKSPKPEAAHSMQKKLIAGGLITAFVSHCFAIYFFTKFSTTNLAANEALRLPKAMLGEMVEKTGSSTVKVSVASALQHFDLWNSATSYLFLTWWLQIGIGVGLAAAAAGALWPRIADARRRGQRSIVQRDKGGF